MYRASNGCGRPMISAIWTALCILLLRNLWSGQTPCGQQNADGGLERHVSECNVVGCRFNQVGGTCARDVLNADGGLCTWMRAFGKW